MPAVNIETRLNAVLSSLMVVLQQEDPLQTLDVASAMQVLTEVKSRSRIAFASDLECWLTWWQMSGQRAGGRLHQSIPAYMEFLVSSRRKAATWTRRQCTIRRILRALGCPAEDGARIRSVELLTSHATIERERRVGPRGIPFGWDKIKKCIQSADPDNRRDVKALAGMLVMYEAMAWSDQIFGHCHGGVWQALPARRQDLRPMPDGAGLLHLTPMKQGESVRSVRLSALAMEWIDRANAFGGKHQGPLLAGSGDEALKFCTWQKWAKALISRSGMDARAFSRPSLRLGMVKDLDAAGFTVDEVLREGGWSTRSSIIRFLHGKTADRARKKTRRSHEFVLSRTNTHQLLQTKGEDLVLQMKFPGM